LVSVRPSTKTDYDKALRRICPVVGSKLVSEITRRDVDGLISVLSMKYAPSTTRKSIVIFKMVMRMGVDHDYLDKLPLGGTKLSLPKIRKRVFEPLSREQVKTLIGCTPDYWKPLVRLLITSGLRRSEAWGLRVQDLDVSRGVLHVRGQLIKGKLVDLKSDAAYRDIPLPRGTLDALRLHLATLPASHLGLLFPTPEGKPVDPTNFYARVWIPTRSAAGLPHFRLHDCRHHVASVYLSQGRSITYVQRLLGHSQPSTLLSIYSWVTKGESDIATSEFEKWLGEEARALYAA
jgi:integrase